MVRKLETGENINSASASIERNSNGTTSYADSLKNDFKKKKQQQFKNDERIHSSTAGYNGNGNSLLNEFVVSVSNIQQQNPKIIKQSNVPIQLINHFSQSNNVNSNKTINVAKKRATLIAETTKSSSTNTISTFSTKQLTITSTTSNASAITSLTTKKESPLMEIDCNKKKIYLDIIRDELEFIEIFFPIKGIIKDTFKIEFNEKNLKFKFKTTDNSFLKLHNVNVDQLRATLTNHRIVNGTINGESTSENRFNPLKVEFDKNKLPFFIYAVKELFEKIIANECSFELNENCLKIKLRKKVPIKWGVLEIVPMEMGTNFLKSLSPIQKVEDSASKYKPLYKNSSNVNKLINGYPKNENSSSTTNQPQQQKEQQKDEIPIPPPLPENNKSISIKNWNIEPEDSKKEIDEHMFSTLLITPLKENDNDDDIGFKNINNRKPIPLSLINKSDDEEDNSTQFRTQNIIQQPSTSSTPSLKLNLANVKGNIGCTGLSNLGNTCYMNSCLQCLSNTIELRDYFLNEDYKDDLNRNNPFGSGGNLAEAFSEVLYKLWCGESSYFLPSRFKRLIDDNCSQFIGYSQHDSTEFMEHFLDVLHEDLNKVDRKNIQPAKPIENEDKLTDEQLADEHWSRFKERNDSIITNLFYGQYKSKLVCPICAKISITFDPFLYLPIPLTKNKIVYDFYFFPLNNEQPPQHISCKLPQGSKVLSILEFVASKTGIENHELVACQISEFGELEQEFRSSAYLPDNFSKNSKLLFVYQKPEDRLIEKFVVHQSIPDKFVQNNPSVYNQSKCGFCNRPLFKNKSDLTNCTKCRNMAYCSEKCKNDDSNLHAPKCRSDPVLVGWPFMLFTNLDTITYDEMMNKLENSSLKSVEVIETQIEEETINEQTIKEEKRNDHNEEVNVALEIKEGQLDIEMNSEESDDKTENEEKNDFQDKSTDSLLSSLSVSSANEEKNLQNHEKEEEKESNEELLLRAINNSYNFILRGKKDDLKCTKELIYVPKDSSCQEQSKFRKSLRSYFYLYIDWKEKSRRLVDEESDKFKSFSLNIRSKSLKSIALGDKLEFNNFEQEKSECTLEDLMTKFTEPETLSSQEAWVCPTCKEPRTASKELTIWRPPKILIIQLKRFSYSSYVREKIGKFVNYPVNGLDISKFCTDSKILLDQGHKPIYDLYAVIDHFGGLYGGHYTANANIFVNGQELGWRAFNDSSVRNIDQDAAVSHSAYILFYRLRTN